LAERNSLTFRCAGGRCAKRSPTPQIGVTQRVFFLNNHHPWPFINPEIIRRSKETIVVWDACLSFLCIFFKVTRFEWIDIRYQDLAGAWHEVRAEGDLSSQCNTKSIIWTGSSRSIASRISKPWLCAKNSNLGIGMPAPMPAETIKLISSSNDVP